MSWVAHALTTDPASLFRANIFYPHTTALAFSEGNIVEGAIGAPVWLLTKNPYTTHNFVFLVAFAQSFIATYYLVRRLTGDRRAAAGGVEERVAEPGVEEQHLVLDLDAEAAVAEPAEPHGVVLPRVTRSQRA